MKSLLSLIIITIAITPLFSQQTRQVPQEYSTIQGALNASQNGDLILVGPGIYYENIVWNFGKNGVEIRSTGGAENTIIDANNVGRPLYFNGNQIIDDSAILDGFTLRNGFINSDFANGGGILIYQASPTLRNLIVEKNRLSSKRPNGGGMNFYESSSIVENCIIRNNTLVSDGWAYGAGIYSSESDVNFNDCLIQNNISNSDSWAYGGGIYMDDSNDKLNNCVLQNNKCVSESWAMGGGVYLGDNSAQLINCTIDGNTVDGGGWSYGAGIYIDQFLGVNDTYDILGCKITNNAPLGSRKDGSAIYTFGNFDLNIINCVINNNGTAFSALYLEEATIKIINSTIFSNESGISCYEANLEVTNTVIWDNIYTISDNSWQTESNITVDHSLIEGGYFGPGNIDSDPLFLSNEVLIPTENSPCLNAGTKDIPIDVDIRGNERPFPKGSAPDIGAYEIDQNFAHILSRFFYDENNNGIQEPTEEYIGRGAILIDDDRNEENIDTDGIFSLVEPGTVKINYHEKNTGNWILTSPVSEHIFDVVEDNFSDTIFFGIYPSREIKNIVSGIYGPALRCNRTRVMEFFVKNEGSTREDGILWAQLDPLVSEVMPLQTPDYIDGDRFGWDFSGLLPGQSFTRYVSFKVPGIDVVEQGQLLKFIAEATVLSDPDCIATYIYEDDVRCSYDPNDKLVNPDRDDNLILRDQDVTYTIRFQNVGNDYADDVVVVDTLDSHFDYSTFKLLKSSHPDQLRYTLSDNGILNFDFHQIFLPDSITDEQGSHGYIMYSIRPDSTLANFIAVENTAYIYFDFNPAIVTNTTINSVVEEFPVGTKNESVAILEVHPNPSKGQFNLPYQVDQIEVFDERGKFVKSIQNASEFDLFDAVDGIYFIRAVKDSDIFLGKVVLLRN